MTNRKLRLAINPRLIDKNAAGDKRLFVEGFENQSLSIEQLAEHIKLGHAFTAELNGRRKATNFGASDVVAVDIDYGMNIEQALAHPLVAADAGLVHTTVSHTPEAPRLRIVFPLAVTITDAADMKALNRALTRRLGGDPSATDAARIFFGNRGAQTWVFPDRALSADLQRDLIAQGMNPPESDLAGNTTRLAGARSRLQLRADHPITLAAHGRVLPLSKVPAKTPVYCPCHDDQHASGFVVVSERGVKGVFCSACVDTFWSGDGGDLDFNDFDPIVHAACRQYKVQHHDLGRLGELFGMPRSEIKVLLGSNAKIVHGVPAPNELQPGVTLVKSAKGSGKTESLLRLLKPTRSVLLIGNRRSLIDQVCRRLDLRCYLDAPPRQHINIAGMRVGICLDSLLRIVPVKAAPDVLILDEAEQVLAHFLSDTLERREGGGRQRIFQEFAGLVRSAKHVIALDADLGFVTYSTLARMRHEGSSVDRRRSDPTIHVWLNEAKPGAGRVVQIYDSKNHLVGELKQALAEGKRVYVTSNSKKFIELLFAGLAEQMPELRQLMISADTRPGEAQRAFLNDPATEALRYGVILTTPAVSTGVDISFPGGGSEIDVVVGVFESLVLDHFEIDQQIGRVRNPGEVKIWINPRRFGFETNVECVKREMLQQALFKDLLIDYEGPGGTPRYREDDAFIEMAAQIVARKRASKNDLRHHFIDHKRAQGCEIVIVSAEQGLGNAGSELGKLGTRLNDENFQRSLLGAVTLRLSDFHRVKAAIEAGAPVAEAERWSLARTKLELYYRQPASAELIKVDERGKHRKRVGQHARVLHENSRLGDNVDDTPLGADQRFVRARNTADIAIARTLRLTPLLRARGFDADAVVDTRDLGRFAQFVQTNKSALENLLGIEIRRDLASKPMSQLKSVLRLIGLDLTAAGSVKDGDTKIYRYRLDRALLDGVTALLHRRDVTPA